MNMNKLKGKIVENGMTMQQLAHKMDVNPGTLYRKISKQPESFTTKQVYQIVMILDLNYQDTMDIFFDPDLTVKWP